MIPHFLRRSCEYPVSEKNSSQWSYTFLLFSLRLPMHSSGSHSLSGQPFCGCVRASSLQRGHKHAEKWLGPTTIEQQMQALRTPGVGGSRQCGK